MVTSAGGIEEDFIKCMAPSYIGDFEKWSGSYLRSIGVNRTGNLLIPNDNYVEFENWILPLLDIMHKEQEEQVSSWVSCGSTK